MSTRISSLELKTPADLLRARQMCTLLGRELGLEKQDQIRLASAVSDVGRNTLDHARGGRVEFWFRDERELAVLVRDQGPGIADPEAALQGRSLAGVSRLVDALRIDSAPGQGTRVWLVKRLPVTARVPDSECLLRLQLAVQRTLPPTAEQELRDQSEQLLQLLESAAQRERELQRLNLELEETNRGVMALYAELNERAENYQNLAELKTRFLSEVSHELRTPLNSILAISRLLLDRTDGDLSDEQERQVEFIRSSAVALTQLVTDLLDLAKTEAGKMSLRITEFDLEDIWTGLRGMLRPLLTGATQLIFDDPPPLRLRTDERKLNQILRNLLSNGLKFTPEGEVRLRVLSTENDQLVLAVSDTGVGISPRDQARLFEDFTQVDSPLQAKLHGTGLGLSLSRRLAQMLGGRLWVESELGTGSTFFLSIPVAIGAAPALITSTERQSESVVLAVEPDNDVLLAYKTALQPLGISVQQARSVRDARRALQLLDPVAVLLEVLLPYRSGWSLLAELKHHPLTRQIPVAVVTDVDNRAKAEELGADVFARKPVDRAWLRNWVSQLPRPAGRPHLLVIDDEPTARYIVREALNDSPYLIREAADGAVGLQMADAAGPAAIVLDMEMPQMDGFEVLRQLASQPHTKTVPVIIHTQTTLTPEMRKRFPPQVVDAVSKSAAAANGSHHALVQALARAGLNWGIGE